MQKHKKILDMTNSTYAEKAIAKRDIITILVLFVKLIRYKY